MSHKAAVIPVTLSATVFIKGTSRTLCNVLARLTGIDGKKLKRYTMLQNLDHSLFSIRVHPPKVGRFRLTILGSVDQNDKTLHEVVSYFYVVGKQSQKSIYIPNIWVYGGPALITKTTDLSLGPTPQ